MPETCIGKLEMSMCPHLVVNSLNKAETQIEVYIYQEHAS